MDDNRKLAEEMVFALWKANTQTHDDRIAIAVSALEARYKAGVEAMRDVVGREMVGGDLNVLAAQLLEEVK